MIVYCPHDGTKLELQPPFMPPMDMTPYRGTCPTCKGDIEIKVYHRSRGYRVEYEPAAIPLTKEQKAARKREDDEQKARQKAWEKANPNWKPTPMKAPSTELFFMDFRMPPPRKVDMSQTFDIQFEGTVPATPEQIEEERRNLGLPPAGKPEP